MKTIFKKSLWPLVALVMVMAIGCEKEPTDEELIVGTWTLESVSGDMTINGKAVVTYFVEDMQLTEEEAQTYASLFTSAFSTMSGTITIKDDNTYTANMDDDGPESGTWELSGKNLSFDDGTDDASSMEIVELTENKLIVKMSETENDDINGDDVDETLVYLLTMNFTK